MLLIDKFEIVQELIMTIIASTPCWSNSRANQGWLWKYVFWRVKELYTTYKKSHGAREILKLWPNHLLSETFLAIKLLASLLPNFYCFIEKWVYFRNLFESLTNNNESLRNIEWFHYLKFAVKEAICALKKLAILDNNYNERQ